MVTTFDETHLLSKVGAPVFGDASLPRCLAASADRQNAKSGFRPESRHTTGRIARFVAQTRNMAGTVACPS